MLNEISEDPYLVTLSPIAHPSDDPAKQIIHHVQDLMKPAVSRS